MRKIVASAQGDGRHVIDLPAQPALSSILRSRDEVAEVVCPDFTGVLAGDRPGFLPDEARQEGATDETSLGHGRSPDDYAGPRHGGRGPAVHSRLAVLRQEAEDLRVPGANDLPVLPDERCIDPVIPQWGRFLTWFGHAPSPWGQVPPEAHLS